MVGMMARNLVVQMVLCSVDYLGLQMDLHSAEQMVCDLAVWLVELKELDLAELMVLRAGSM